MTSIEPPAPAGTKYDGDPRFEAMVFGWAASSRSWNGEQPGTAARDRSELAGFFEQYLEQQSEAVSSLARSLNARRIVEAIRVVDDALVNGAGIGRSAALTLRDYALQQLGGAR